MIADGRIDCPTFIPGKVAVAGKVEFLLPAVETGMAAVLKVTLSAGKKVWDNFWNIWVFPAGDFTTAGNVKVVNALDDEIVRFIADGGAVLLTDNFPGTATANAENFRSHTSGRSLGHAGALFKDHPIWEKFPNAGFLDWQFFPMMRGSFSLMYDKSMPEFTPLIELIPSFKMVKHKSMLSEFVVGKGRLMISGLRFDAADPGAKYMLRAIVEYLNDGKFVSAPVWEIEKLAAAVKSAGATGKCGKKIDAGGRPID